MRIAALFIRLLCDFKIGTRWWRLRMNGRGDLRVCENGVEICCGDV